LGSIIRRTALQHSQDSDRKIDPSETLDPLDHYAALHKGFRWQVDEYFNIAEVCCSRWARPAKVAKVAKGALGAIKTIAIRAHQPGARTVFHTYSALQRAADALSHQLAGQGVVRGDRVAIVMPQRFETAVAYMAVFQMGAVAMPLSMLFGPQALAFRLQDSAAVVAICDESSIASVQGVRPQCPALRTVVAVGAAAGQGDLDYTAAAQGRQSAFTAVKTKAGEAAVQIYTSGTTGPPKGALLPHRALIGNLPGFVCSQNGFGFDGQSSAASEAVFWSPADWTWTGGLMDALLPTLYFGRPIVAFNGRFSPELAFNLMEQQGVTHTFLLPTALKAMMKAFPQPREQFTLRLQGLMSAGEAVGDTVFTYCRDQLGVVVNELFGQTEINYVVGNCAPTLPTSCGSLPPEGAECRGSEPASAGLDGTKSGCVSQSCGRQGLRLRPGEAGSAAPARRLG
jgi:acetyl-CoA synthetase